MNPQTAAITPADAAARLLSGGRLEPPEALHLLQHAPRAELRDAAHRVTAAYAPRRFDFCAIVNARSGRCGEDCSWCAQSAHWPTDAPCHGWIGADACLRAARDAEARGASRIGIVTSGRDPGPGGIDALCDALHALRRGTGLHLCASVGILGEADLRRLHDAGLQRVHCNLETAPTLFPSLCTTHTQEQKLATLRAARCVGLELCCGGIIGMGETDVQLVEFAFALAAVAPDSIPVNILHPIPGTPLGSLPPPTANRILDAVCILRLANPRTPLRFAGGRTLLDDATARLAIHCGIDAGIAGPLLTTPGASYATDRALALEAGYGVAPA